MADSMSNGDLPKVSSREDLMRRIQTSDSVWLPRDVFETLYLNPERKVAGNLRQKFANPTPVGLLGLLVAGIPVAAADMGWRGAGGHGGALITVIIFFGGVLLGLAGLGEFLLGNTFSTTIFFWISATLFANGTTLIPWFGTGELYSSTASNLEGMATAGFSATLGFFNLACTLVSFIFTVCALRTNVIFVMLLTLLTCQFATQCAAQFKAAEGNLAAAQRLTHASGAILFTDCFLVMYGLILMLFEAVEMPIKLPLFDLSQRILAKPKHDKTNTE